MEQNTQTAPKMHASSPKQAQQPTKKAQTYKKAVRAPMQSQKIEQFEQFYEKSTDFVHVQKQQTSNKLRAVFDQHKQQKNHDEGEEDLKLDPEAPAYIPHATGSPWTSALIPGVDFMQILQAQTSNPPIATTPKNTLPTVPEEG